jgi:hypothetical protein
MLSLKEVIQSTSPRDGSQRTYPYLNRRVHSSEMIGEEPYSPVMESLSRDDIDLGALRRRNSAHGSPSADRFFTTDSICTLPSENSSPRGDNPMSKNEKQYTKCKDSPRRHGNLEMVREKKQRRSTCDLADLRETSNKVELKRGTRRLPHLPFSSRRGKGRPASEQVTLFAQLRRELLDSEETYVKGLRVMSMVLFCIVSLILNIVTSHVDCRKSKGMQHSQCI